MSRYRERSKKANELVEIAKKTDMDDIVDAANEFKKKAKDASLDVVKKLESKLED